MGTLEMNDWFLRWIQKYLDCEGRSVIDSRIVSYDVFVRECVSKGDSIDM